MTQKLVVVVSLESLLTTASPSSTAAQARDFLAAMQSRKLKVKTEIVSYRAAHASKSAAAFNLVLLVCCKQVLCSKSVVAHRIDDDNNNDGAVASSSLPPRCVQVCQWCNRWQTISSDVAYKKGSPVLGRFVINGLNRSLRRTNSDDDDDNNVSGGGVGLFCHRCCDGKRRRRGGDKRSIRKIATAAAAAPETAVEQQPFPLCKYMAADRWCLQGIAFVSSQWLVCTCLNCERPYVRDFTVPETPACVQAMPQVRFPHDPAQV